LLRPASWKWQYVIPGRIQGVQYTVVCLHDILVLKETLGIVRLGFEHYCTEIQSEKIEDACKSGRTAAVHSQYNQTIFHSSGKVLSGCGSMDFQIVAPKGQNAKNSTLKRYIGAGLQRKFTGIYRIARKKPARLQLRSWSCGGLRASRQAREGSAWCRSLQTRFQRLILEWVTHSAVRVLGRCRVGRFCPWPVNAILLVSIFQNDNNFSLARRAHFASPALWAADVCMF